MVISIKADIFVIGKIVSFNGKAEIIKNDHITILDVIGRMLLIIKDEIVSQFGTEEFKIISMHDGNGTELYREDHDVNGRMAVIDQNCSLFIDDGTGIAWFYDPDKVEVSSCHPHISVSDHAYDKGKIGYWRKNDRTEIVNGNVYNIDRLSLDMAGEKICSVFCRCKACRRQKMR